jgi:hypothetical protein
VRRHLTLEEGLRHPWGSARSEDRQSLIVCGCDRHSKSERIEPTQNGLGGSSSL